MAEVARRNDVAARVLFSWHRQAPAAGGSADTMVPVLIGEPAPIAVKPRHTRGPAKKRSVIEIDLGGECRVSVDAGVDADALARVIDVLSRR